MIISIASGKGGTGKTTVACNLAGSVENVQLLDCDVEEPNVHILLQPIVHEIEPVSVLIPKVQEEKCNHCGACADFCEYNALFVSKEKVLFFPELCHSCGGCSIVCPKDAIIEGERQIGVIKKGEARGIKIVYGELNIGEPMAVPLIKEVKKRARKDKILLIDAPPGTACPLVASVHKSDYCILVTEPTPFGLNDLDITVQVIRELKIPFGIVINRAGIGDGKIHEYCEKENIPILLEIPFDKRIMELYSRGIPFIDKMPIWKDKFQQLFSDIKRRLDN